MSLNYSIPIHQEIGWVKFLLWFFHATLIPDVARQCFGDVHIKAWYYTNKTGWDIIKNIRYGVEGSQDKAWGLPLTNEALFQVIYFSMMELYIFN